MTMDSTKSAIPGVLSAAEVEHFLGCVPGLKYRTILTICYAAGLRISGAVRLKITDIDSQRMVIRVEQGTVEIRTKHKPAAPMHLKSYQIDGKLLRTGAANFSASGLERQDNDLIVIESTEAAAVFKRAFDARFVGAEALSIGAGR
jgi:phosphatidylserine/phosphatidylglycerophosphate/cardiolipin synthase-like enzyme